MEEKRLVLAKQGMPITNIQDITCTLSHSLISWAASFLFTRLDELQQDNYASKSSERDTHFMDKVISEFLTRLLTNVEDNTKLKIASISRANMSGKYYSRNITLIGEKERIPALDGDPSKFWLHLLDGKSPCWSYISEPSQSSCRMLQNMEESAKVTAEETGEARRKRRKIDEILSPFSRIISDSGHNDTFPANQAISHPAVQPLDEIQQNLGVKKLMSTPKNLHLKLKKELSKLIKVLQLPDNVRLMAEQFLEYLLKNHLVILEPVDILHAFNIALCCRAASFVKYQLDQRESLGLAEQCLSYKCNEGLIAFMYEKLRSLKKEISHRERHLSNGELPNITLDKRIESIDNAFSLREKNILDKHKLEISDLEVHKQKKITRLKEVRNLVQEHIRRSHIDEMARNNKIRLSAQWFTMLTCAFLEHMRLQDNKLKALQSNAWSLERQLKENLCQEAKSGQLGQDFDRHIALTDTNFVMEEFIHFKERNDDESSVPDCQPPSNDGLLMEITTVQNTVLSEPISAQAMQNEPVKTSVDCGRGLASDPVDLTENGIHCSSDGIGLPRAGCSPSVIPANDDSIGQESPTGEHRNTEHVERDHIANPSMLLGGTVSVVKVVSASNDCTLDTDQVCLELPILASSQSPETLVETRSDLSSMSPQQSIELSAQQNVVFAQRSPAEEERSGLLETQVNQDLQPEIQPSMLFSDTTPLQGMHSNDRSQTCCEPDRSTSLLQGGAATSDHLGELRMQVKAKNDDNIAADTVQSDSPTYTAHCAATSEVEIQICQSSMPAEQSTFLPAEQSTSLPAQQSLATSRHTPAEAEPAGILGTEAAWDLRPEVQPSTSMRDQPGEAAGAGILCAIAARDLQPEMQSSTSTQDVPFERSCLSGMPELQSLTVHQSVEPSLDPDGGLESVHTLGMVTAHDLQQEVQQTSASMLAEQSTSLPAQLSLATSRQPPAEAEPAGILVIEAAWDLQPGVQPSTSMQDQPAEEGQAGILGTTAARNLQPEMQSSASTQDVPSERTCLPGMAVLQTPTVHQSVEPSLDLHAGVELARTSGMVIAHDLQSEIRSSDSMPAEQSILPAQHILATSRHPPAEAEPAGSLGSEAAQDLQPEVQSSTPMRDQPAEAEGAGILGAVAAQDLQPEMQPSTSTQDFSFEKTCLLGMPVPQSIPIHRSVEPSLDPHASHMSGVVTAHDQQSETQPSVSMQDRPAEAGADMLGTTAAQDLQPEMRSSTTEQEVPHERTLSEERRQVVFQPNMAPRPGQPTGLSHVRTLVFNNPIPSKEPLKNELARFNYCYTSLFENFEQKKSLLLEDLRKLENTFLQQERELIDLYMKVFANQSVAENFRRMMFTPSSASQGRSMNPVMDQQLDSSSATQTSVSPVTSSSGILLPVSHSAGSYDRPSLTAQPSSSWTAQLQPAIPSNLYGATPSPSVRVPASVPHGSYGSTSTGAQPRAVQPQPILPGDPYRTVGHSMMTYLPHGSYRSAGAQPHAPVPHLQQLSMRPPYPYAAHANQQHLSATPVGAISWEHYAAGMTGNFAATSSQASGWQESMANFLRPSSSNPLSMAATQQSSDPNIVLGSTAAPLNAAQGSQHAPSLVHDTISSASRLRPAHPESLLPSGWRESMANFLQSSSSNPLSMAATQQSSDPNIVLGRAAAPLNAAPGSQHGVVTGSQSALPSARLPARLGVTSSPADTSASPVVLCLSDDDDEQ